MVDAAELATDPQNDLLPSKNLGTILIIEDDLRMQRTLQRAFAHEHYATVISGNVQRALDLFRSEHPLAVVLDPILPGISGRELCRIFKQQSSDTPIIVLIAITDAADKVLLLESGADEYVTKPFSPRELTARVQAAIRRQRKPAAQSAYRFGDCEVDFKKMTVLRNGKPVVLSAHEFKLLKFFTDNAKRVLTRDVLLNEVWGYNFYPATRTVDNHILKLRQKLEPDPTNPIHLVTIYGAGYKFVP